MLSARLPCWTIFSRLPFSVAVSSSISVRRSAATASLSGATAAFSSSSRSTRQLGEIVDEVERVLDLVRDAGGELAERRHLLRLHQPVLRAAQIGQRGLGCGARAAGFLEQPRVLDGEHGLSGKGLQQGDEVGREAALGAPADHQAADNLVLAQQRHREHGMDARQRLARSRRPSGPAARHRYATGARIIALRPRWVSPSLIRRSRNAATRSGLMPKADLGTKTSSIGSNS